jgi:DNA-binding NarL/FixJ family response regulator
MAASKPVRILIVDDHPIVREGLVAVIQRQPDFICCGEADGGAAALAAITTHQPDLVLMDLRLRSGDGLEVIKSMNSQFPALRILVVSQFDELVYAERVMRAGAHGYVMKEQAAQEVVTAIRTILGGDIYASPRISALALRRMIETKAQISGGGVSSLSDRELEVFQRLGNGMGTRQIASDLHLSVKTIETHRQSIKHKLGLHGAGELVRQATDWVRSQSLPGANPAKLTPKLPPPPGGDPTPPAGNRPVS